VVGYNKTVKHTSLESAFVTSVATKNYSTDVGFTVVLLFARRQHMRCM